MRGKKIKVVIATFVVLGILVVVLGTTIISSKTNSSEVTKEVKVETYKPEGEIISRMTICFFAKSHFHCH